MIVKHVNTQNGKIAMAGPLMTFSIPKVKRSPGCRSDVPPTSRNYKETLQTIQSSFLDSNYKFEKDCHINSIEQVVNKKFEKTFQQKRQEVRSDLNCVNVGERFAFAIVDCEEKVKEVCRDGINSGHEKLTYATLGKQTCGVHLWQNADVVLRSVSKIPRTLHLIVYKVIRGRAKLISPSIDSDVEPTPNFECHVSRDFPKTTASLGQLINTTQIFIYEYDEECLPVKRPRHCYPYAVVTFSKLIHSQKHQLLPCISDVEQESMHWSSDDLMSRYMNDEVITDNTKLSKPCENKSHKVGIFQSEQDAIVFRLKEKLAKKKMAVESSSWKMKNKLQTNSSSSCDRFKIKAKTNQTIKDANDNDSKQLSKAKKQKLIAANEEDMNSVKGNSLLSKNSTDDVHRKSHLTQKIESNEACNMYLEHHTSTCLNKHHLSSENKKDYSKMRIKENADRSDCLPESQSMIPLSTSSSDITVITSGDNQSLSPMIKKSFVLIRFTRKWLKKYGWGVQTMTKKLLCNCIRVLKWIEVMGVSYRDKGMNHFNFGILDARVLLYYLSLHRGNFGRKIQLVNEDIDQKEFRHMIDGLLLLYRFEKMPEDMIVLVENLVENRNLRAETSRVGLNADKSKNTVVQNRQKREDNADDDTDLEAVSGYLGDQACSGTNIDEINLKESSEPKPTCTDPHPHAFISEDKIVKIIQNLSSRRIECKQNITLNIYNVCSDCGMKNNQTIIIESDDNESDDLKMEISEKPLQPIEDHLDTGAMETEMAEVPLQTKNIHVLSTVAASDSDNEDQLEAECMIKLKMAEVPLQTKNMDVLSNVAASDSGIEDHFESEAIIKLKMAEVPLQSKNMAVLSKFAANESDIEDHLESEALIKLKMAEVPLQTKNMAVLSNVAANESDIDDHLESEAMIKLKMAEVPLQTKNMDVLSNVATNESDIEDHLESEAMIKLKMAEFPLQTKNMAILSNVAANKSVIEDYVLSDIEDNLESEAMIKLKKAEVPLQTQNMDVLLNVAANESDNENHILSTVAANENCIKDHSGTEAIKMGKKPYQTKHVDAGLSVEANKSDIEDHLESEAMIKLKMTEVPLQTKNMAVLSNVSANESAIEDNVLSNVAANESDIEDHLESEVLIKLKMGEVPIQTKNMDVLSNVAANESDIEDHVLSTVAANENGIEDHSGTEAMIKLKMAEVPLQTKNMDVISNVAANESVIEDHVLSNVAANEFDIEDQLETECMIKLKMADVPLQTKNMDVLSTIAANKSDIDRACFSNVIENEEKPPKDVNNIEDALETVMVNRALRMKCAVNLLKLKEINLENGGNDKEPSLLPSSLAKTTRKCAKNISRLKEIDVDNGVNDKEPSLLPSSLEITTRKCAKNISRPKEIDVDNGVNDKEHSLLPSSLAKTTRKCAKNISRLPEIDVDNGVNDKKPSLLPSSLAKTIGKCTVNLSRLEDIDLDNRVPSSLTITTSNPDKCSSQDLITTPAKGVKLKNSTAIFEEHAYDKLKKTFVSRDHKGTNRTKQTISSNETNRADNTMSDNIFQESNNTSSVARRFLLSNGDKHSNDIKIVGCRQLSKYNCTTHSSNINSGHNESDFEKSRLIMETFSKYNINRKRTRSTTSISNSPPVKRCRDVPPRRNSERYDTLDSTPYMAYRSPHGRRSSANNVRPMYPEYVENNRNINRAADDSPRERVTDSRRSYWWNNLLE
ncbi:uncharacterized protein [Antedon mediterranea]|uniref:uncharacterized protein n=1 Tax=Antedon mediterranea TaxID=105859 RepID=UPI003AF5CA59